MRLLNQTMESRFRYEDLPAEIKLKILEHAFGSSTDTGTAFTSPSSSLVSCYYYFADDYHDNFYNCTTPSELTIYPDARFRQLFVSKDFLHDALPIFAKGTTVTIQMNSARKYTSDFNEFDLLRQTLRELLLNAIKITIIHSILAKDNHLDESRLLPLLSASRLEECNLAIEMPRFWFRRRPTLLTTTVGRLTRFAFEYSHALRILSVEELEDIGTDKIPPRGLLDLFDEHEAPSEVRWYRNVMLPILRSGGFTGRGSLQIDIVACRDDFPLARLEPLSFVCAITLLEAWEMTSY